MPVANCEHDDYCSSDLGSDWLLDLCVPVRSVFTTISDFVFVTIVRYDTSCELTAYHVIGNLNYRCCIYMV